jgi:signal transduction histidine kinase
MQHSSEHLEFVSHELRNALMPRVNYVGILELQGSNPQTIDLIVRQIARLQSLMDGLLLGKSENAASTPEWEDPRGEDGIDMHLMKPASPEQLLAILDRFDVVIGDGS